MTYIILTTLPTKKSAEATAEKLIRERLAACVSIIPDITSLYRWKGKRARSREYLLLIKTQKRLFSRIETLIKKIHPYEVPELLGFPVAKIGTAYAKWLKKELRKSSR